MGGSSDALAVRLPNARRRRLSLVLCIVVPIEKALLIVGAARAETTPSVAIPPWASYNPVHTKKGTTDEKHPQSSNAQKRRRTTQEQIDQYEILSSEQIHDQLQRLASAHPNLCTLTTAQKSYNLPVAGNDGDCPFDKTVTGCPNYIMTIQDYVSHPPGSESDKLLPEVFLSGCLHGNERVGPTAVTETMSLLIDAAECESKPNVGLRPKEGTILRGKDQHQVWLKEIESAKACREALQKRGVTDVHRKWLARLVSTRRIVIMPTANALGYFQNTREEGSIDPNRDFPYDLQDSKLCMRTIAGRAINEVFREHMFRLSITFHGGMEAVAYEWGAPSYLHHLSPDHFAQQVIASGYSRFGGSWRGHKNYQTGTMNDVVYYVRGGMEDWAYAGSWDPDRVVPCTPSEFGGYDSKKTVYNNSTLRVFNMLVETSNLKTPAKADLGSNEELFNAGDESGNGHISRNMRLSLLAIDVVEPYVSILGVNGVSLADDVIPLTKRGRGDQFCSSTKVMTITRGKEDTVVEWTVGGAFSIDETQLFFANWNDVTSNIDCLKMPDPSDLASEFTSAGAVGEGKGMFANSGPYPFQTRSDPDAISITLGPIFSATIDTTKYQPGDKIAVIAMAKVDGDWAKKLDNVAPNVGPQSHMVNTRTDPNWRHESAGKIVQGQVMWFSVPLTLLISFNEVEGTTFVVQDVLDRFADSNGPEGRQSGLRYFGGSLGVIGLGLALLTILVLNVVCCSTHITRRIRKRSGGQDADGENEDRLLWMGKKPSSDNVADAPWKGRVNGLRGRDRQIVRVSEALDP